MLGLLRGARRLYRSPAARSLVGLLCIGLLTIAANVIAAAHLPWRLDVTADRLYTLSAATRRTLARIDEPIALRLYYSPALGAAVPADGAYAERVRLLLEQYVAAAPGKLRLDVLDPEPLSAAEAEAGGSGLTAVPLDGRGEWGYFGLAGTNSTDDRQVIALFDPAGAALLEGELTRLVRALAFPNAAGEAGEAEIIAHRRRSPSPRSLALIDNMRRRAAARYDPEVAVLRLQIDDIRAHLRPLAVDSRAAARLRGELLTARRRLRAVQQAARQPVERLEASVEIADIAALPVLLAGVSLAVAARRRRAVRAA